MRRTLKCFALGSVLSAAVACTINASTSLTGDALPDGGIIQPKDDGSTNGDGARNGNDGGANGDKSFTIQGKLASLTHRVGGAHVGAGPSIFDPIMRTISHVMAVNPQTSSPDRVISTVASDGSFSLAVTPGRPYVLVFIDSTQVGVNMIVGIFKAETLDTLAPRGNGGADGGDGGDGGSGAADLGTVGIDPATGRATAGTSYDELLSELGLSHEGALTLGAVDDLSLRLTNPDIDGDGKIDALTPGQEYWVDFHTRTEAMRIGGESGPSATITDITNKYLDATGVNAAFVKFNLASIYAVFPVAFDGTTYVNMGMMGGGTLADGGTFTATEGDGGVVSTPSSFSGTMQFGDHTQWGPDYDLSSVQMPGSDGYPAKLVWGMGAKALTFPNVVTRTKTQLEGLGTIVPFLQLVTDNGDGGDAGSGKITQIKYKYMKRVSSTEWTDATDEEVALIVNDNGGFAGFYLGSKSTNAAFQIPRQASGTIPWNAASATMGGSSASADQINNAVPTDICNMAFSYDDKLGLRIFAGNVNPVNGVTVCN